MRFQLSATLFSITMLSLKELCWRRIPFLESTTILPLDLREEWYRSHYQRKVIPEIRSMVERYDDYSSGKVLCNPLPNKEEDQPHWWFYGFFVKYCVKGHYLGRVIVKPYLDKDGKVICTGLSRGDCKCDVVDDE